MKKISKPIMNVPATATIGAQIFTVEDSIVASNFGTQSLVVSVMLNERIAVVVSAVVRVSTAFVVFTTLVVLVVSNVVRLTIDGFSVVIEFWGRESANHKFTINIEINFILLCCCDQLLI